MWPFINCNSWFSLMAWVTASGNISAEQKKPVYENPVVTGNLGKTGKSIQSENSVSSLAVRTDSFKVVCVDSKDRSSLLRCCLKSMQNSVLWLLVCNKYATTTCEHGIVFSLKITEIMLWHIASRLLVLGECFFSIKFRN